MKIVKFKDGTYGIRKWHLFEGYSFLRKDVDSDDWWSSDGAIDAYCKMGSLEYAKTKLETYLRPRDRDYGKPISTWTER